MLKKQPQLLESVILLCVLFMMVSCNKVEPSKQNSCLINAERCLMLSNLNIELRFKTDKLIVEEPTQISIKTPKNIENMWLEGLNMNMGKIPFVINRENSGYSTQLFLGMCSEPQMTWRLYIEYQDGTNDQFELISYWQR